jgi:hypothetical protein
MNCLISVAKRASRRSTFFENFVVLVFLSWYDLVWYEDLDQSVVCSSLHTFLFLTTFLLGSHVGGSNPFDSM